MLTIGSTVLGVNDVAMPCTPERVWRAIRAGGEDPWREPPAIFDTLPRRGGDSTEESGAI